MPDYESRINLRLPHQARADLDWLAAQRQVPHYVAAGRAFALDKRIMEAERRGGRIVVEVPGEPAFVLAPV